MMTSSPGSTIAINAAAIASVAPQVTVSSVSGSTVMPYQSAYFRASASRRRLAPQVIAYWLMSARIARAAASLMTSGAGKLGKPWARLMAPCSLATRVIPRMTDSVKPWVRREVCMDYQSSYGKGVGKRRREEASRKGVVTVLLDAGVRRLRSTSAVIWAGAACGDPGPGGGGRAPPAAGWQPRWGAPVSLFPLPPGPHPSRWQLAG